MSIPRTSEVDYTSAEHIFQGLDGPFTLTICLVVLVSGNVPEDFCNECQTREVNRIFLFEIAEIGI